MEPSVSDMFALDGDVLQQALQEEESQDQHSATASSDELHHSLDIGNQDGDAQEAVSEGMHESGQGRHGIIKDLPAAIRVSQVVRQTDMFMAEF